MAFLSRPGRPKGERRIPYASLISFTSNTGSSRRGEGRHTYSSITETVQATREQRKGFNRCGGTQATGHVWSQRYDWPEAYFTGSPVSAPVLESAGRHLARCQCRL